MKDTIYNVETECFKDLIHKQSVCSHRGGFFNLAGKNTGISNNWKLKIKGGKKATALFFKIAYNFLAVKVIKHCISLSEAVSS